MAQTWEPSRARDKADFSRFVVAGDSLSAGYQNGQLIESGQVHGYANVIATQAGVDLNLPLLPYPGYPQITLQNGFAVSTGYLPVSRSNKSQTLDPSVPGYTLSAMVGYQAACNPDPANPLYPVLVMAAEILNPGCANPAPTELAEAAALAPTTAILWTGNNDALFSVLFGADPTDTATFANLYHVAASTMAQASRTLVMANIPDVTRVPYLTSVARLADALNLPVAAVQGGLGLSPGDMVTPYAFGLIQEMGTVLQPLPDSNAQGPVVIRAARIRQIRATVEAYNAIIAREAAANGAVLVDVHGLMDDLADHGIVAGGQRLTTDFMGGLFSLDGVHPTNTGYAIIANEFIRTMNRTVAAGIPPASIAQVAKTDPGIFADGSAARHTGHVSREMADALRCARK